LQFLIVDEHVVLRLFLAREECGAALCPPREYAKQIQPVT
jgi:hypothetical protein